MCKWFCTSTGPSTSLKCLHCGAGYCGACLHGEGGKMESLIKCSSCGKKPRTQGAAKRGTWKAAPGPDATASSVGNESEVGTKNPSPGAGTRAISNDPTQEKLAGVFDQYCKFAPASTALDNVKWFKCVSELDLVDNKTLTRADVDLIFTKVKAKGERRINFQGFRDALSMVARKKNGVSDGEGDEVELLGKLLAGKLNVSNQVAASTGDAGGSDGKSDAPASPTAAGGEKKSPAKKKPKVKTGAKSPTTGGAKSPKKSPKAGAGGGIFDKLTDASQYTGSHKHRFDAEGKGKGLAGRDSLSKGGVGGAYHGGAVNDLSQIMRTNLHQAPAKGSSPNAAKDTEMTKSSVSGKSPKKSPKKKDGPSIFDKLTDASQYTGAHKHRFDSSGKGRGLAGRDSGGVERGGKVSDLSQITNRK